MKLNSEFLRDIYLVIITIVLFFLFIGLLAPYTTTLLITLLLVASFQPLHKAILKRTNKSIATGLSTLIIILMIIIPGLILGAVVTSEINGFAGDAGTYFVNLISTGGGAATIINNINSVLHNIDPSLSINLASIGNNISTYVSSGGTLIVKLFENVGGLVAQLILSIFALVVFFQDYDKIPKLFVRFSPLNNKLDVLLYDEFIATGKALIRGIFLIGLIHALGIGILFFIFGVKGIGILFILIFLVSVIPSGSQLVWVPVGIVLGLTSGWPTAILLLILCFIYMNFVDTLIRPKFTKGNSAVHPLLSILSVFGGITIYGLAGILYGPLITIIFLTLIKAYNQRFNNDN